MPIALGLGSPSVSPRKALLALAAAFLRETGCSLSVDLRFKVRLPAASIGAKCFSVVSLHANGREDSLAAKTWLICGSVHHPLFALSSFLQMPIPFTNRCKYAAFCEMVSALSGFCIIRLSVNCSYNSHYEELDGVERCIDDELPFPLYVFAEKLKKFSTF